MSKRIRTRLDAVDELHDDRLMRSDLRDDAPAHLRPGAADRPDGRQDRQRPRSDRPARLAPGAARRSGTRCADVGEHALRSLADSTAGSIPSPRSSTGAIVDEPPIDPARRRDDPARLTPTSTSCGRPARMGSRGSRASKPTERERTGIKSLKVGYNRSSATTSRSRKPNLPARPGGLHPQADDCRTPSGSSRRSSRSTRRRSSARRRRPLELEYELFGEVREQVADEAERIQDAASAVAELDVLAALAEVARGERLRAAGGRRRRRRSMIRERPASRWSSELRQERVRAERQPARLRRATSF